jgi:hypothetical protein
MYIIYIYIYIYIYGMSRDSSVGIATDDGLDCKGLIPVGTVEDSFPGGEASEA